VARSGTTSTPGRWTSSSTPSTTTSTSKTRATAAGIAAPILLPYASDDPSQWFAAGTVTLDIRPVPDHLALKLEYRHDQVHQPAFFRGQVEGEGTDAAPFIANARAQDTLTLGLHAWF